MISRATSATTLTRCAKTAQPLNRVRGTSTLPATRRLTGPFQSALASWRSREEQGGKDYGLALELRRRMFRVPKRRQLVHVHRREVGWFHDEENKCSRERLLHFANHLPCRKTPLVMHSYE
jgi:hypothetical protein